MNAQTESIYTERQAILGALSTWIRQRPGLDYRNYSSGWNDVEGRRAYFRELRFTQFDAPKTETYPIRIPELQALGRALARKV